VSRHDGTAAGASRAAAARKPFVVEEWLTTSFTYRPVKGYRFTTLEEAVSAASRMVAKTHVVTFDEKTRKPMVVWES